MYLLLCGGSASTELKAIPYTGLLDARVAMETFAEVAAGGFEHADITVNDFDAVVCADKEQLYWKIEEHGEINIRDEKTEPEPEHLVTIGITEADIDEVLAFYQIDQNKPLSDFIKERCIAAFDLKKDLLEEKLHAFIRTIFSSLKSVRYILANGQGVLKVRENGGRQYSYELTDNNQCLVVAGNIELTVNGIYVPCVIAAAEQVMEKLGINAEGAKIVR